MKSMPDIVKEMGFVSSGNRLLDTMKLILCFCEENTFGPIPDEIADGLAEAEDRRPSKSSIWGYMEILEKLNLIEMPIRDEKEYRTPGRIKVKDAAWKWYGNWEEVVRVITGDKNERTSVEIQEPATAK